MATPVRGQADGVDAKVVLQEFGPDLAILEAKLGAVPDGYALAQLLRSLTSLPIMFVAYAAEVADRLAGLPPEAMTTWSSPSPWPSFWLGRGLSSPAHDRRPFSAKSTTWS